MAPDVRRGRLFVPNAIKGDLDIVGLKDGKLLK
jgi:hypothetical protein